MNFKNVIYYILLNLSFILAYNFANNFFEAVGIGIAFGIIYYVWIDR